MLLLYGRRYSITTVALVLGLPGATELVPSIEGSMAKPEAQHVPVLCAGQDKECVYLVLGTHESMMRP